MTIGDLMSAIAAGASALAGIAAAVAAFRSAKSSEESRQLAASVELRSLLREISAVVVAARLEHTKIKALAERLANAQRRSAVSAGSLGDSRQRLLEAKLQQRVDQAQQQIEVSAPFIDGTTSLQKATSEDASRVLHIQQVALAQLQATSSELSIELNTVESQLLQYLQSQLTCSDKR